MKYFRRLCFIEQAFPLREGISDLLTWHAPEFSTSCHSCCGNTFCQKGHSSPRSCGCRDCTRGREAGRWEKIVKEVEGRAAWRKKSVLCPSPLASQHVEDNDSAVWNRGVRGQALCALHPAWMARGLRESVSCCAVTVWSAHWSGKCGL